MFDNLFIVCALILLTLALICIVAAVKVGAWWLRLTLIDLLAIILVKQLDKLAAMGRVDFISDAADLLLTFLALLVILFSFISAYFRRRYLVEAETRRKKDVILYKRVEQLEELRARSRDDWGITYPKLDKGRSE